MWTSSGSMMQHNRRAGAGGIDLEVVTVAAAGVACGALASGCERHTFLTFLAKPGARAEVFIVFLLEDSQQISSRSKASRHSCC
jgi:hypothetical protein